MEGLLTRRLLHGPRRPCLPPSRRSGKLPRRHGRSWASLDSAPSAARQRKGRPCTPKSSLSWASEDPSSAVLKVKTKPATKAGKREMFGQVVEVKATTSQAGFQVLCNGSLKRSI